MSVIRMDIEVADQTLRAIDASVHELADALQIATTAIEQLRQAWEGTASRQFSETWVTIVNDLNTRINNLQPLQAGLLAERNQIVEADQSFTMA